MNEEIKNYILNLIPEIDSLAEKYKKNEVTEFDVAKILYEYSMDPNVAEKLEEYLRATMFFKKNEVVEVNPLYAASVLEQLQFDDDIPELRNIPLPKNTNPAVPVVTESKNLVLVGRMLEEASKITLQKIESRNEEIKIKMINVEKNSLIPFEEKKSLISQLNSLMGQTEGYLTGQTPEPLKVNIETREVLNIPRETQMRYVWKSIASRQGRRSLIPVITSELSKNLKKYNIVTNSPQNNMIMSLNYEISIMDFGSITPEYDFVGNMVLKLEREISSFVGKNSQINLEIKVHSAYEDRVVGWTCNVYQ